MIKKIPVSELKAGMCVADLEATVWRHAPFLYTKPGLVSEEDLAGIRTSGCLEVFIDTGKGLEAEAAGDLSEEERLDRLIQDPGQRSGCDPVMRVPMHEELPRAHRKYKAVLACARRVAESLAARRPLAPAEAEDAVEEVIDSVARNPGAMLCLSKLHKYDRYTLTHAANVCGLSVLFGTFLGLPREQLLNLGLAGLLHDAGMILVPQEALSRRGPLSRDELERVRAHPAHGRRLLAEAGGFPQSVLRAVAEHHEQHNGLGYPHGLRGDQISRMGRMLALCDVFDAMTSDRSYMKAVAPSKALAIMYGMRGQNFVPGEADLFIKCVGIYPPGSLVRLNSGDLAVVYGTNQHKPLLPLVNVILDRRLRPRDPRLLDLASVPPDDQGRPRLKIIECLNPLNYMFDLRRLLGVELVPA
jgi:HD-GYP domain-containing protein (c-di-GMP phosphodiesterase class II)